MIANPSFSTPSRRRVSESTDRRGVHALLVACLTFVVAACGADDLTAPRAGMNAAHPTITVTPNYSTFDKRSEFNGAGVVDYLNGFDEFNVDGQFFPQESPWTTNGVTYTSVTNVVLGRVVELGIQSAAISTDFGAAITGTVADSVPVTLFGANLMLIGDKVPVTLLVRTNLGAYAFNLDVPLAEDGQRFFGIALSKSGEYVTGFQFSVSGSSSALLLDDVAVGHMGAVDTNADPVATVGGPYVSEEGSAVALALGGTDSDGDVLTFSWNLGDGTAGSGSVPPANHVYADNGTYDIMLAVDDGHGGVDTARTTATISNVAPSLAAFSVPGTPIGLTPGGVTVSVSSSFTDPGTVDTHTASLDCGNGGLTSQSEVVGETATSACSFSGPGVYPIRLTVRDKDGGSDTKLASGPIVVYDAAGGRLTSGGWIASPAGAVVFAPAAAGKLTFSMTARYESGSSIPTGKAELTLNVGKLEFRSTSLDWLVATEASAQLQGRGTLNGSGDYAFAVLLIDGQSTGAARIRIWNRATGTIVYDSRPGAPFDESGVTALGGGSIQLHAR